MEITKESVLNRVEFHILNQAYNKFMRRHPNKTDLALMKDAADSVCLQDLQKRGLIAPDGVITEAGKTALEPYRVNNAVILAAGAATRFVPLSLEQPKGLYEVKGETLIERQIKQLLEAGINDITIVLGYKKEMFFYLRDKYHVRFIFNTEYAAKNNIESIYLSRDILHNTYICFCDDYFTENPFNRYEYASFNAGYHTHQRTNEMYVVTDDDSRIVKMEKGLAEGKILMGHTYWTSEFSSEFIRIAEADRSVGIYNNMFWEWLVKDHLEEFPPFYLKEYAPDELHEFDYFEQLRAFDKEYVDNANSRIIEHIRTVFQCRESDIIDFRTVNEGMTNTSFVFQIDGTDYIYRHPGDGTEKIIDRTNEQTSLIKAKELGIDPTYIFMDPKEGWKISKFVHHFREPDYSDFEDSRKILAVLRKLHSSDVIVDYGMRPWEDAEAMEKLLKEKDPTCFDRFEGLKEDISALYRQTSDDGIKKCFCHGDTYKPNWMIQEDGTVILIDWEYAGYSDPGIDVGYYIVDAMYDFTDAERFVREYLQEQTTPQNIFHFMAYTAIIAYYWFVWAMYRESCGAVMGESLYNWYSMAVKYSRYLLKK